VDSGRWEITGSTWVEVDCNIPSANPSSVRSCTGSGRSSPASASTPTSSGSLTRSAIRPRSPDHENRHPLVLHDELTWNDTTKFPYNSFWWEGIRRLTDPVPQPPVGLEAPTSPKGTSARAGRRSPRRSIPNHVLLTYGFGDGGGGVSKKQILTTRFLRGLRRFRRRGSARPRSSSAHWLKRPLAFRSGRRAVSRKAPRQPHHARVGQECEPARRDRLYESELLATDRSAEPRLEGTPRYPSENLDFAWKTLLDENQFQRHHLRHLHQRKFHGRREGF